MYPDDPGVIHNVRQRSYNSLTIREDRDAGERKTADMELSGWPLLSNTQYVNDTIVELQYIANF